MQHTKHLLITCFILNLVITISAQQGNIAAGGDATGSGGSMSYSFGQTDYLMYTSGQGSVSFGLQQPFFSSIPIELEIPSTTVTNGEVLCFNAEQTVTIAGDGKLFIVQSGGSAEIIAGINILLKEGCAVEYGGMLHAYISTNWCNQQLSLLASFEERNISVVPITEPENSKSFFKVYPNPTTGTFTLELFDFEEYSVIKLEIFTIQGNVVFSNELPAEHRYTFNLDKMQPGVYLIRVLKNDYTGIAKIIKQ